MENSPQRRPDLQPRLSSGGLALQTGEAGWRLEIPAGEAGTYRLAQVDDYAHRRRSQFAWQAPVEMHLEARSSSAAVPGTWGFGLWNDPFSLSLGLGGGARRIPSLPNCAWFFFASPENYLSLRDDQPAAGALAATFRSPHWPAPLLALAGVLLPLLAVPRLARGLRRLGRGIVLQESMGLQIDSRQWHSYHIAWQAGRAVFSLDGQIVLETPVSPLGPLGLVVWIDNQYAALPPDGRLRYGTLANPHAEWIEVRQVSMRAN